MKKYDNICFLEGKIVPEGIKWETSNPDAYQLWAEGFPHDYSGSSHYRILGAIDRLDIKRLGSTDYYFIYISEGESQRNPEDISDTLERIINHIWNGINIQGETTLGISSRPATNNYFQGINAIAENDIFWDVNNDVVIVKGQDALRTICMMLAYEQQKQGESSNAALLAANAANSHLMNRCNEVIGPDEEQIQKAKRFGDK